MKIKRSLKVIAALLVLAAFTVTMLTGCGSSPAASSGTDSKSTSTAAAASTASGNTDYHIAWYASAPHPYFEDVKKGVEAFEKDYGITVDKQIGPDWKQESETANIEALAAKGAKAFAVYPSDPAGANGLYDELTQQGIHFVNFGASSVQPTTASFCVATDVKAAAAAATEALIKSMGGKGNIINVLEVLEDANTKLRKEGVEETVKKYPDVHIIQEVAGMTTVEEAVQKVSDAISANVGKVDGIIATGNTASSGIAQVLSDYNSKGGKPIHSIGIDTAPEVMKAIKDGVMDATIAQNTMGHGYLSCLLLKYLQDGWTPRQGQYFVNAGYVVVTKDNIDTYSADLDKVTADIKASLETTYLEKK